MLLQILTNSVAQEPEGSSPHSQQPATGPCPETVESTPHPPPRGGGGVVGLGARGPGGGGGGDWFRLSQDWDRWRAVVSAVMNLRVLAPQS
jgi:hypothetical protein